MIEVDELTITIGRADNGWIVVADSTLEQTSNVCTDRNDIQPLVESALRHWLADVRIMENNRQLLEDVEGGNLDEL